MGNRTEIAAFLRAVRERKQPADVGLPGGGRRRTPGLRRQEVAELAGISIDHYVRLEQARGSRPSRQVLSALARALLLTADEREYLFRVAGESPSVVTRPCREVRPAVRYLLESLSNTPAYVVDAKYDVLAWNYLATWFIGHQDTMPPEGRNMVRSMFDLPDWHPRWLDEEMRQFARASVADLRAAYGRYPGDAGIAALVADLMATSTHFAAMWAAHEVEARHHLAKTIDHPNFGTLEFQCQVLHVSDTDQRLIVYCAEPGSSTDDTFKAIAAEAPSRA